MNKEIKKIFLVLICYSLAAGVFYSFQELWLADNNLSTKTIGIVYSLCALLSVSTIFLCTNLITKERLKKFTTLLFLIKGIVLFSLFLLHNSGFNVLIKFLIMVDYVVDVEIYASIYPMITMVTKSDKIYALRSLVYSYAYYTGTLLTSILLGKTIINLKINFNTYSLVAGILILVALLILKNINLEKYYSKEEKRVNVDILSKVVKKIKNDKMSKYYLLFSLTGNTSYACINGLAITLLTTNLGFTASGASNFKLILGIAAAFIGTLILEKLTLKNDYINLAIKFIGRFMFYALAFIFNNRIIFLIAIMYMYILAESYSHIADAPYVNRFDSEEQLAFCNLKEMSSYIAKAIGNLICGFCIVLGVRYNFLFALIFVSIQIIAAFKALKLRNIEKSEEVL